MLADEIHALVAGEHSTPHRVLGAHAEEVNGVAGVVIRAMHPAATAVECLFLDGPPRSMDAMGRGLFSVFLPGRAVPLRYRLRFHFPDGATWERGDPYRFLPTLGDLDLHLLAAGTHWRLWEKLGAHLRTEDGEDGVAFAVWAPNAKRVSVVGDFCGWDPRLLPMRALGGSGIFELFVPGVAEGAVYQYEILTQDGTRLSKSDPCAGRMQLQPGTASIVVATGRYQWQDASWMRARAAADPPRDPMLTYEMHLGSWARVPEQGNRSLTYREIAPKLVAHLRDLGMTHVEFLPLAEHPFTGSWGYQTTGYFAPTSRYGSPDDFRFLIDTCHQAGIGVILDWSPAHFPKDEHALYRFDGMPLYEYEDPRRAEHPDWGTLVFNYGRPEVRNFLIANALYWLEEFHIDGIRVDAVASMLYLDYSRKAGEWDPNRYGGREHIEAIDFLRLLNDRVNADQPGCVTIAEESTAWPGVTHPTASGGLGFTFKWNMGWMHDTLKYFSRDPIYRSYHQGELTFAMMYEYSERFIMPLSHDEAVHGKGSLLGKMPGDQWQRFATLRLLLAYLYTRPGKKLLFMGTELAPWREWNHDSSLDWHLAAEGMHRGVLQLVRELGALYRALPAFWRSDHEPDGFAWIDMADRDNCVLSYVRSAGLPGAEHVIVVLNPLPLSRVAYRIGAPSPGSYREVLNTDAARFDGSDDPHATTVSTEPIPWHGCAQSLVLMLPPLAAVLLVPVGSRAAAFVPPAAPGPQTPPGATPPWGHAVFRGRV